MLPALAGTGKHSLLHMLPLDLSHLGFFQDRNWIRTLGWDLSQMM